MADVRVAYAGLGPDSDSGDEVHVVGQVTTLRRHGRLSFAMLRDDSAEIQLFIDRTMLAGVALEHIGTLRRGDHVAVRGTVMTTRRGELSIRVRRCGPAPAPGTTPEPGTPPGPGTPPVQDNAPGPERAAANAPGPRLLVSRVVGGADLQPQSVEIVAEPGPVARQWPARVVAGLTALTGLLELSVILPPLHHRMHRLEHVFDPSSIVMASRVLSVLVGLGLLLLADQLAKRKQAAWRLAVALFGLSVVAHVVRGQPVAVYSSLAMVLALVAARRHFRTPPDPPSLLRLLRFLPTYLGVVLLFGVASLYLERDYLVPDFSLADSVGTVLGGLVGLDGDYTYLRPRFEEFYTDALLGFGVLGLAVFATLVFRPLRARGPHTEADWGHAQRLVRAYGSDTLAYFTLRDDKSFYVGSDGRAFLAYTYSAGYALVAGNPIGAPTSVPALLDEFLGMCDRRGWNVAFLAIRRSDFSTYAARGFRGFYLGDEAILRCNRYDPAAAPKGVRAAVRRVGRTHRFLLINESDASPALVAQLNAISARWRGKTPERGFTMSLSQDIRGEGTNPDFLLCVALDEDDRPGGFLRLIPVYGDDPGYTLDLMRHDPAAPNGMTEFLITSAAHVLGGHGVGRLSMNFAMWGRLFADDVPFTPVERMARRAVLMLNPFFQIRSLRRFNAKFSPEWQPRMLAYRRPSDLPRVGLLYAAAEGFLAIPGIGDMLVPKAVGGVASPSAPVTPAVPSDSEAAARCR